LLVLVLVLVQVLVLVWGRDGMFHMFQGLRAGG
jgi:hypothetical protein